MFVKLVFFDDLVGHGDTKGFHGMGERVVIGSYHLIEVVNYVFFRGH